MAKRFMSSKLIGCIVIGSNPILTTKNKSYENGNYINKRRHD